MMLYPSYDEIAECFHKKYQELKHDFVGQVSLRIDQGGWLNDDSKVIEILVECVSECNKKLIKQQYESLKEKIKEIDNFKKELESKIIPHSFARLFQAEYEKAGLVRNELITNTPDQKRITAKIEELIMKSKNKVTIAGWIDAQYYTLLKEAKDRGVEIRVLTKKLEERASQAIRDAESRIAQLVGTNNIKRNSILHSRFIISDDTDCILSTADFNTASATSHYEAGIFTNNPKIIYGLINHFEQIWNDTQTKSFRS